MKSLNELKDQLKVEGILSKGFGHITKFLVTDIDLSIEAKSIYAYFSSFSGGGECSFPSRSKIIYDLNISKDRYYKHYNQLIKEGYIEVEQKRYFHEEMQKYVLGNNIYTLISNPKKFQEEVSSKDLHKSKGYSRLKSKGMKALGYGTIPKAVMLDERLDIKAKGIYAYLCSFSGSGNSAFPKTDNIAHHLQISKNSYYKYYKQLVDANYIEVEQRQIAGKFGVNDYYLNENPDEAIAKEIAKNKAKLVDKPKLPCTKNKDTQNKDTQNKDTQNKDTQNKDTQNKDTYNTNSSNTNSSNTNNFITNSSDINSLSINLEKEQKKKNDIREIERLNPNELKEIVKRDLKEEQTIPYKYTQSSRVMRIAINILTEYDDRFEWHKQNQTNVGVDTMHFETMQLFNEALAEMLTTEKMNIKGSYISYAKVYDKVIEQVEVRPDFMFIGGIMDNAINDYINVAKNEEIYSPLKYMQSVIWTALLEGDIKITSEVDRMWGRPSEKTW